jgi:hypothetical protein
MVAVTESRYHQFSQITLRSHLLLSPVFLQFYTLNYLIDPNVETTGVNKDSQGKSHVFKTTKLCEN